MLDYSSVVVALTTILTAFNLMYMLKQKLVECGLTINESKVFLAALELGPSLASTLSRKTGINRSTVYAVINTLKGKGLLSSVEKLKTTYFCATDPEILIQNIESEIAFRKMRLNRLNDLIPRLNDLSTVYDVYSKAKFFEGIEGIKALHEEILRLSKNQEIVGYSLVTPTETFQMRNFWPYYFERRKKFNISVRLIAPVTPEAIVLRKRDLDELRETRLVPMTKFPFGECEINIFEDYYAYFSYGYDEMIGSLIKDRNLALTEKSIFEFMWEAAASYDQEISQKMGLK